MRLTENLHKYNEVTGHKCGYMTLHGFNENSALALDCIHVSVLEINSEMFVSADKHHEVSPDVEEKFSGTSPNGYH